MATADIVAIIEKMIREILAKIGAGSAASADLREKAKIAISDAGQAIEDWKQGGVMEDVEAAGELAKTLADLAMILREL